VAGAALAALAVGCGGSHSKAPKARVSAVPGTGGGVALSSNSMTGPYPAVRAKTLAGLRAGSPVGPVSLSLRTTSLRVGTDRVAFDLTNPGSGPINGPRVAIYTAASDGTQVRGPFAAHSESLVVPPRFQSRSTSGDLKAPYTVNVAYVPFEGPGKRIVTALVGLDNRWWPTGQVTVTVRGAGGPPAVGERAVRVHTPTGAAADRIDTRVPPARALHRVDLAAAVGRRPVVLVIASARGDRTHASAPVLDAAEQTAARFGRGVAFVGLEAYRNGRRAEGLVPAAAAWRVTGVPWTFVIDRSGTVTARFEGSVSARELESAVGALGP
jgi:hypothetical protein